MIQQVTEHKPNSLIQELYTSSEVDEVGGFGKKGWGKSWSVLHECLHDIDQPDFSAIIFRATSTDFEDLWNKAKLHFAGYNPDVREDKHRFTFPSGARVKFSHLQHASDIFTYNGQEYQLIVFDELPQFHIMPYLFMFSCLRGPNPKVLKRIRATGNPFGIGMTQVKGRFFDVLRPTIVKNGTDVILGEIGWFRSLNGKDTRAEKAIERDLFQLCKEPDWRTIKAHDPILKNYLSREWYFGERSDNIDLMKGDPDYEAKLDQLPEKMKLAFKDGLFAIQDHEDQLISAEWWENAVNGKNAFKPGKKAFGIDYAEGFNDKSVNCEGTGNQPYKMEEWEWTPHPKMAEIIRDDIFGRNGIYQIHGGLDSVGTGAGVYTTLESYDLVYIERTDPIRYKDPNFDKKYEDSIVKYHFPNVQTQILWKLREDFQEGNIDLSLLITPEHYYEGIKELEEEVLAPWFRVNGNDLWISGGKELRKTQRTKTDGMTVSCLGRSPDRLKALAIWNWVRDKAPGSVINKFIPQEADYGFELGNKVKPNPQGGKAWV